MPQNEQRDGFSEREEEKRSKTSKKQVEPKKCSTDESAASDLIDPEGGAAHIPVMLNETLELLDVQPGKCYVDATAGAGGHLLRIAKLAGPTSRVFGFDRDIESLKALGELVPENVTLIHSNYEDIKERLAEHGVDTVDGGILADLGVSSMQLDDPLRGFSFQKDGPLDMRMDTTQKTSAEYLINQLPEAELADIIFRYGEERRSRQIASAIVRSRPLSTTSELAEVVSRTLNRFQKSHGRKRSSRSDTPYGATPKNPATRTFQALRIAVNNEIGSLENFLADAVTLLSPGARLAVISFHSLEDRLVKQFLKTAASSCICPARHPVCNCGKKPELEIITRKPVVADKPELLANNRSRSAKLRAGRKL